MRKYALSLLTLLSLAPTVVFADVLPDGYHSIDNCVAIDNIASYPGYDFWLTGTSRGYGAVKQIQSGQTCELGSIRGEVIAIRKTDWPKVRNAVKQEDAETYTWANDPANKALLIDSNQNVSFESSVPNTDPTVQKQMVLHVDAITGGKMAMHVVRTVARDGSGNLRTLSEAPVAPPVKPTPATTTPPASSTGTVPSVPVEPTPERQNMQAAPTVIEYRDNTNYWLVGELALFGVVGLAILSRSWKK